MGQGYECYKLIRIRLQPYLNWQGTYIMVLKMKHLKFSINVISKQKKSYKSNLFWKIKNRIQKHWKVYKKKCCLFINNKIIISGHSKVNFLSFFKSVPVYLKVYLFDEKRNRLENFGIHIKNIHLNRESPPLSEVG